SPHAVSRGVDRAAGDGARAARAGRIGRPSRGRAEMSNGPAKAAERAANEEPAATAAVRRRGKQASRPAKRNGDDARRLRLAELLLEVTRRVAKCESLDDVLHVIVELTVAELGAERGSLFLNDPASGEL